MDIGALSPTKVKQSRLCMARLKARYSFTGEYEEEQGEPAKAGTLAHAAAKIWYRREYINKAKQRFEPSTPDEAWTFALEECANYIDPSGAHNDQRPTTETMRQEAKEMFLMIVSYFNRDKVKVIAAERKYKGTLAGLPVSLIVDLILDLGNGVAEIIDFKTGFLTMSDDECQDDDQALMNILAVSHDPEFAPYATKRFRFFWCRQGFVSEKVELSWQEMQDYQKNLALDYQNILDCTEPKETINKFCKSCGRKNECEKFKQWLAEAYGNATIEDVKLLTGDEIMAMSPDEIFTRFDRLKGQTDALDSNRKALGEYIKSMMEKDHALEVRGLKFKAAIQQNKASELNTSTVITLAQKHGKDLTSLVDVRKTKTLSAFSDIPEALTALNMTQSTRANASFVAVRAVNNNRPRAPRKAKAATTNGEA